MDRQVRAPRTKVPIETSTSAYAHISAYMKGFWKLKERQRETLRRGSYRNLNVLGERYRKRNKLTSSVVGSFETVNCYDIDCTRCPANELCDDYMQVRHAKEWRPE